MHACNVLSGPDICCSMLLNTGSGGIDIFEVMLTVCGQQHSFSHTNGCSCESVKVSEKENVSTRGAFEHPTFGLMPNALTYWTIRVRHLLSHVFEHRLWWYRYFWSKVSIWNDNCVRATAFIFTHERVFLWKCQSFWDRKCLHLRGTRTPDLRIDAECSNLLSYPGQTFAVPCFWTQALAV